MLEQKLESPKSEYEIWEDEKIKKLEKSVGEELVSKCKEIRTDMVDRFYGAIEDKKYEQREEKLKELITYEYAGQTVGMYLKSVTEKEKDGKVIEKSIIGMMVPDIRYSVEMRRFLGAYRGDLKYSTDLLESLVKITKIEYKQREIKTFKVPTSMREGDLKLIQEISVKPEDISCFVTAIDKEGKEKTYEFERWEYSLAEDTTTQEGIIYQAK
jgi:hypothetical protein